MSIEEVGELFQRGQDRFETSDFAAAIELWTRAYEGLPDDPALQATRALLMANIAQAHVEAHAMDGEIDHLRHADRLFQQYLGTLDPKDEETRAAVQAQREKIAAAIAEHDAALERSSVPPPEPAPTAAEPIASTPPVPLPPGRDRGNEQRYTKTERAMVIGGGVTLAFGLATVGALATFWWLRNDEQKEAVAAARDPTTTGAELRAHRRTAARFNRFAISTGAAAGVLTAVGIGVIAAAEAHRVRRRRLSVDATFGPRGLALGMRGRF